MWLDWGTLWLLLFAVTISAQQHAIRGYFHAEVSEAEEEEENTLATDNYIWNNDEPDIWRWNVEKYPHPKLEPRYCMRMAPSNLCDPDQILTKVQAEQLDSIIRQIFNETSCICDKCSADSGGIQIGIALLKHTYKPYNEKPGKIIRTFTKNLRSKWRLGECDDDILIVLATEDRLSYTDIGETMSGYISVDEAYRVFLENKANFTEKRYSDGLRAMLATYRTMVEKISREKPTKPIDMAEIAGIIIGVLLLLAILAVIIIWKYKKCKRKGSDEGSSDSGGVIKSSTWRKKITLLPRHITTDTYKPCKTVDDVLTEEPDKHCFAEESNTEEPVVTSSSDGSKDANNGNTASIQEEIHPFIQEQKDIETIHVEAIPTHTEPRVLTSFTPKTQTVFHQTDL